MEHQTFWKPEKTVKEKSVWKPGKKEKKELPEWKRNILSHHVPKPSAKDRGDFPRKVIEELILEAAGKCRSCLINKDHTTHHVMPRAPGRGGRGVKTNGLRLCWSCHDRIQTNEAELQHWIDVYRKKYGEYFWFDEQDWQEHASKQASLRKMELLQLRRVEHIEKISDLISSAAGRPLASREEHLIESMDAKQAAVFYKLIRDVIK